MTTSIVSFICPGDIVEKIEGIAKKTGLTRSMAIRKLIENLSDEEIIAIITAKKGGNNENR